MKPAVVLVVLCIPPPQTAASSESGEASWYNPKPAHVKMYGKVNGAIMLAAHRTLRPTSICLVRCHVTGKEVVVEICGYGPSSATGRFLDLSKDSFEQLAPSSKGVIHVTLTILYRASAGKRLSPAERTRLLQKARKN